MLYTMHHGKIHRATVTQANLEYMGSITIDSEAAGAVRYSSGRACTNR